MTHKFSLSIIVAGWYFNDLSLFNGILEEAKTQNLFKPQFYIASHKTLDQIESALFERLRIQGWNILFFDNQGWDWGAYQQCLQWQLKNENLTDYYLFLHDDVRILKRGFLEDFYTTLNKKNAQVIGNSLPYPGNPFVKWKQNCPEIFRWAHLLKTDIKSETWKCVRGSCFFSRKAIPENVILKMPIKHGNHVGYGNWSVRIFGGMVADVFGIHAINYLSHKHMKSPFIEELYRGRTKTIPEKLYERMSLLRDRFFKN